MDSKKFTEQVTKEISGLNNYAYQLTRDRDNSKDMVQDTLLKAFRYQQYYKEGTNLKGWLFTILKNNFINSYRRNVKRNTFLDYTDNSFYLDTTTQKVDNEAELRFIRKDLEEAIQKLPKELKLTFLLNAEGYKYHEIATELAIPLGTVKTRIFTAKRILRKSLQQYGDQFGIEKMGA